MFSNLTKEIFIYSVIPAGILALIVLVLLLIGKKKDDNFFKYNYGIKILLLIIIGLVLPLIVGYTIWTFEKFSTKGESNILYMTLLVVLIVSLIALLVIACSKLMKSIKNKDDQKLIDAN